MARIFAAPGRRGGYDVKRLTHVLETAGVAGVEFSDDAMIGAHLLDPSHGFADVEDAAAAFLGLDLPEDAAAAADATLQLIAKTRSELESRGQLSLYEELELPLAPVLAKMERAGVAIDPKELRVIGERVDASAEELRARIYDLSGEEFNIGSPQQLGKVLFGKLNIPGAKKTKTGWATGVEVLQSLAREYPICALVLEWREVTKLKNTYVNVIPQLVDPKDGRLRTEFNQTATATGRLSLTNPNLQNIPVRGELGRRIRRAFVARQRRVPLARGRLQSDRTPADGAPFRRRSDAARVRRFAGYPRFHRAPDLRDHRRSRGQPQPAAHGKERQLRPLVRHVGLWAGAALGDRPGRGQRDHCRVLRALSLGTRAHRRHDRASEGGGYVSTILGRRRYMPGLTSGNYMLRAAAEREATNAPLQGSAADLMKLAMVRIARALAASGLDATMLLQIHDELIFEVRRADVAATAQLVRTHMETALELRVPLEVTIKTGRNWYDVEPMTEESLERV